MANAEVGQIVEWTDVRKRVLQGKVTAVKEVVVIVDTTIMPNYIELGLQNNTVVNHKKYKVIEPKFEYTKDEYLALSSSLKDKDIKALWKWHSNKLNEFKRMYNLLRNQDKEREVVKIEATNLSIDKKTGETIATPGKTIDVPTSKTKPVTNATPKVIPVKQVSESDDINRLEDDLAEMTEKLIATKKQYETVLQDRDSKIKNLQSLVKAENECKENTISEFENTLRNLKQQIEDITEVNSQIIAGKDEKITQLELKVIQLEQQLTEQQVEESPTTKPKHEIHITCEELAKALISVEEAKDKLNNQMSGLVKSFFKVV